MDQDGLSQRLERLREYYLVQGPLLVLVLATSLDDSPLLAWAAGILLLLLTLNRFVPR